MYSLVYMNCSQLVFLPHCTLLLFLKVAFAFDLSSACINWEPSILDHLLWLRFSVSCCCALDLTSFTVSMATIFCSQLISMTHFRLARLTTVAFSTAPVAPITIGISVTLFRSVCPISAIRVWYFCTFSSYLPSYDLLHTPWRLHSFLLLSFGQKDHLLSTATLILLIGNVNRIDTPSTTSLIK